MILGAKKTYECFIIPSKLSFSNNIGYDYTMQFIGWDSIPTCSFVYKCFQSNTMICREFKGICQTNRTVYNQPYPSLLTTNWFEREGLIVIKSAPINHAITINRLYTERRSVFETAIEFVLSSF